MKTREDENKPISHRGEEKSTRVQEVSGSFRKHRLRLAKAGSAKNLVTTEIIFRYFQARRLYYWNHPFECGGISPAAGGTNPSTFRCHECVRSRNISISG